MATRITDIQIPANWVSYLREQTAENSRLFQSGAIATDQVIDTNIQNGGVSVHIPFWKDLGSDNTVDTAQGDNPGSSLSPGKVESGEQIAPVLRRVVSFGAADLSAALAGDDPMRVAADRIVPFWNRRFNAVSISVIQGSLAALDAEAAGSGIHDVAVSTGPLALIDADAVIDAKINGLGDASDDLTLMFVHSKVYGRLQKENLIDFIPDARGEVVIPTYLGMQLVVSDTLPTGSLGSGFPTYTSFIAGAGALRYGEAAAKVPTAIHREELEADGAGVEYFTSRRDFVIHPLGFRYTGSVPDAGPVNSVMAAESPNVWARAFERKNIPLVGLRTNG
jgi:hypothetical protein